MSHTLWSSKLNGKKGWWERLEFIRLADTCTSRQLLFIHPHKSKLNCNNARGQLNFVIRDPRPPPPGPWLPNLAIEPGGLEFLWHLCYGWRGTRTVGLKLNGKKVGGRDFSSSMQSTYVHPDCFFSSIHPHAFNFNRIKESTGNWRISSSGPDYFAIGARRNGFLRYPYIMHDVAHVLWVWS